MAAAVSCGMLLSVLVLCAACDSPPPTAPSPRPPSSSPLRVTPPPPPRVPLTGPSTLYVFSASLDYPVRDVTNTSSYELFANGAFALGYETLAHAYTGSYLREQGRIIFDFGADAEVMQGGGPDAVATVDGDSLNVRYHEIMQHSDFENAVYRQAR